MGDTTWSYGDSQGKQITKSEYKKMVNSLSKAKATKVNLWK